MDFLKAELSKKRKLLESKSLINHEKKFFKRDELIQKEEEDYWKRQENKKQEKRLKQSKGDDYSDTEQNEENIALSAKSPEEIAKLKLKKFISNQNGVSSNSDSATEEERILPRKDVIKRLREQNQPILLFGESEIDAFRRLRKFEILEPDASDKGFRNDFQVWVIVVIFYY